MAGLSLGMYSALTLGSALWLGDGVLIGVWPVVVCNSVTLALAILAMKVLITRRCP